MVAQHYHKGEIWTLRLGLEENSSILGELSYHLRNHWKRSTQFYKRRKWGEKESERKSQDQK